MKSLKITETKKKYLPGEDEDIGGSGAVIAEIVVDVGGQNQHGDAD